MKLYDHIGWLVMGRLKFHLINWCTDMMQCYLGKLRLDLGDYLFKINGLPMAMLL